MARIAKLKDLLRLGKPKTPGFGISKCYYVSVLANRPVLPPLLTIINPKGEGGAVKGFGVPLKMGTRKEELAEPLTRGVYALASPDQKTVLKLTVVGQDEAGFDPGPVLRSPAGLVLEEESRNRIAAAWNILQFTFESHDPMVYPALDFVLDITKRTAILTEGILADPICQAYRLPHQISPPHDVGLPFATGAHVTVRNLQRGERHHLSTLGLSKFAFPEIEVDDVEPRAVEAGSLLLMGAAQFFLQGQKPEPGDKIGVPGQAFRFAEGGLDRALWDGIPCLELIPEVAGQTSDNLLAWHEAQD